MNDAFKKNALSRGEEGEKWLLKIPEIIATYEKKWSLKVLPPFPLSYNYVAPATRSDGTEAVLKIGFPKDREFFTEVEALRMYNGDGVERLIETNEVDAVILIERVMPGVPLSTIHDDEKATRILASVIKKLRKPVPAKNSFIPIKEWTNAIIRYKKRFINTEGPLPAHLVDTADKLFNELISTSEEVILIHGDLHHDNVLSSHRNGWLAIDPKGIVAEPAYETAAMLRNPHSFLMGKSNLQGILSKRISILSAELGINPDRIRKWGIAQTILSTIWSIEENGNTDQDVRVAEALIGLR